MSIATSGSVPRFVPGTDKPWQYPEGQGPFSGCFDCGLPIVQFYGSVMLPNAAWEAIKPSDCPGGGMLCANCIMRRLSGAGISVEAKLRPVDLGVRKANGLID